MYAWLCATNFSTLCRKPRCHKGQARSARGLRPALTAPTAHGPFLRCQTARAAWHSATASKDGLQPVPGIHRVSDAATRALHCVFMAARRNQHPGGPTLALGEAKKRCPMTSGETAADAFSQQYIKLATPVWRSDKAIGIDVTVSNPANRRGGSIKKRVFFPLNLYKNGAVPRWLMLKKERQLLEEMAEGSRYSPDNFVVRGLTANRKAA